MIQSELNQPLVFYTVAEPFIAHLKLSFGATLFVLAPWIVLCSWRALSKPFKLSSMSVALFVFFTCLLFYAGTIFCYTITLPYGINFLLSFSTEQLQPVISVDKFITFVAVFILGFGVIFELPIIMVFTDKTGIVKRQVYEKNRRYAILAISIAAALLTPTPDVVNMMLMGGPLYLLYEIGIIVLKIIKT